MLKIPKLSAPLAKAIRTSEGILVYLVNIGLAAGSVIDPSKLPAKEAAIVGAALTGLHVASRTLLKIAAVQKGLVPQLSSPIEPAVLSQLEGPLKHMIEQAVQDLGHGVSAERLIGQVVTDAEEFANPPTSAPASPAPVAPTAPAAPQTVAATPPPPPSQPGPAQPPVPPANRVVS